MLLSTTPTIEGHTIREYKGIVTGETIIGANIVKDFFAALEAEDVELLPCWYVEVADEVLVDVLVVVHAVSWNLDLGV